MEKIMAIIKNTISFVIIVCGVILCVYTVGLFSTSKIQICSQKDNVSVDTDSNLKTELPRYIYKEHPRYFSGGYNYLSRSEMAAFSNSATFTTLLAGNMEPYIENPPLVGVMQEDGAAISSACFDYQLIDRHGGKLKNIVFNNCNFLRSRIANVVFDNCTFRSSSFSRCKLDFDSIDSSFDNVQFHNCYIDIPYTLLKQTKNFQDKKFCDCVLVFGKGKVPDNMDLSGFSFENIQLKGNIPSQTCFNDAYFSSVTLGIDYLFTSSQLQQTRNYRLGVFNNIGFKSSLCEGMDFKGMFFIRCSFYQNSMKNTDLTDARFVNCDLENVADLTAEQVRSTWNYKHNQMKGLRLPTQLQSQMETELRSKQSSEDNKHFIAEQELTEKQKSGVGFMELWNGPKEARQDNTFDPESSEYGFTTLVYANASERKLKDGANFSSLYIKNQILARNCGSLNNIDFSGCFFESCIIRDILFENCSFKGACFNNCELNIQSKNSDFTGVTFQNCLLNIPYEIFAQSRNFQQRIPFDDPDVRVGLYDYPINADMTNFEFINAKLSNFHSAINITNSYFDSVTLKTTLPIVRFSQQQLVTTANFKMGVFVRFNLLPDSCDNLDFSDALFLGCLFPPSSMTNSDFTGAKFIDCSLERLTNLTVEQIKSTWNYKNNRMDLIKLPPDLQKYFDEEKKEKE